MAKLMLLIDGANRAEQALADRLKQAGLALRVVDFCLDGALRYAGSERPGAFDRPLRALPALLVDSDDGKREIERHEGAAMDDAAIARKMRDGTYQKADAGAAAISRSSDAPEPGAGALARIKGGKGTLADVMEFLAAKF